MEKKTDESTIVPVSFSSDGFLINGALHLPHTPRPFRVV